MCLELQPKEEEKKWFGAVGKWYVEESWYQYEDLGFLGHSLPFPVAG